MEGSRIEREEEEELLVKAVIEQEVAEKIPHVCQQQQ